jgi:hypothetical protein
MNMTKATKRTKARKPALRPRTGLLPGEYKRRSLVAIERLSRDGSDMYVTDNYIVQAHRLDGQYRYTIEYHGESWGIPGKVFDAMVRQRESIRKEDHRRRAKATSERLISHVGL